MFTDDVVYACGAFGLAFTGRDAFVGHVRGSTRALFRTGKLTLKRVIAEGDAVALEYRLRGHQLRRPPRPAPGRAARSASDSAPSCNCADGSESPRSPTTSARAVTPSGTGGGHPNGLPNYRRSVRGTSQLPLAPTPSRKQNSFPSWVGP
ncbi:hypothetical protein GCM10020221_08920 [Streptomyces thioluteus]|uniref:SnoaL-like domain-containing protein n=1 Tax=Streptomyces thioluteus TaxID=66431 RepID=A0ABN3WI26_STRTU